MENGNFFKTALAYENWGRKYQFGEETPVETFQRVARALASVEKEPEAWEQKFFQTLMKSDGNGGFEGLKCTTGGRITSNAGTSYKRATMMNCFINGPVSDAEVKYNRQFNGKPVSMKMKTTDNPDDIINIFLTILEQAKTLASEGGYGINFGFIRPRGAIIKGTGIRHPGVVSYMEIWDAVSECIVKGDNDGYADLLKNHLSPEEFEEVVGITKKQTRKGAMLGALPVWHPDIEEFIRVKQESGKLTKFNMSVLIDDKFMKAVDANELYDLHFKGKVYKRIKARALYDLIMKSTYNRGEPGVLFFDNMKKNNPVQYLGDCDCTNPCGEIPGNPKSTTVCLLGSLNVTQYVEIVDGNPTFNWEQYEKDIKVFARMLDNVNDLTSLPLPAYEESVRQHRQFGMGLNGVGSALIMLGIPYNSKKALSFIKELVEKKENITWQTSAQLAKEKGVFPLYNKEEFTNTKYFKSSVLWDDTKEMIMKFGARNAKTTTNPPLGNSSVICDNVSNGIEPVFELEYERKVICDWPEGMDANNVKEILKEKSQKDFTYWEGEYNGIKYYYEPHNRGLCKVNIVRDYGYQWILDNFPEKKNDDFIVTTNSLEIEDHLNVQQIVQKYCNQSVSKTCNIPKTYPFSKFKNLYMDAWKRGLVGFTTYRQGSMESVLEYLQEAEKERKIIKEDLKLPEVFINGPTTTIKREGAKFYIHFSYLPDDGNMKYPVCMWIHTNAKKEAIACNRACRSLDNLARGCGIRGKIIDDNWEKCLGDMPHNRLARMISLCLRHNIPREDILVALTGIDGDNVSSLLTAVRKFIGTTIDDGREIVGMNCPECGSTLVMESGCFVCKQCGYAGCG